LLWAALHDILTANIEHLFVSWTRRAADGAGMYDTRNSYPSPDKSRRSLREKLTFRRLLGITAILITLSLLMSWPPVPSSSAKYSPWNTNQLGLTKPAAAVALITGTPTADPMPPSGTPTPTAVFRPVAPADAFTLIVDDGLYPNEQGALADDLKQALAYVSQRFGSLPARHFNAVVTREDSCFLHGVAHTEERTVQVSTCNDIGRARAVSIMAHEFVHQLAQDRYGPAHLSADLILAEGVATWGAGEYWLGGQPDFRGYVYSVGIQYPLAQTYAGLGVNAQNAMYYQWASFVEFLISTYGRESFDRIYMAGKGAPGSADYQGVYGKDISVLDQEWQAWVNQ
jgi:hypothetical protein